WAKPSQVPRTIRTNSGGRAGSTGFLVPGPPRPLPVRAALGFRPLCVAELCRVDVRVDPRVAIMLERYRAAAPIRGTPRCVSGLDDDRDDHRLAPQPRGHPAPD